MSIGKALAITESKRPQLEATQQSVTHRCGTRFSLLSQPGILCNPASWLLLLLSPRRVAAKFCGLWWFVDSWFAIALDLGRGGAEVVQVWCSCAVLFWRKV